MRIRPNFAPLALAVVALVVCTTSATAQDQEENQRRQQRQRQGRNNVTRQIMNALKDCELTEEQTTKVKEVIEKYKEQVAEAQKAVRDALPPEIRQQRTAAQQKAREEGLTGAEARKAVDEAVELTEEQREKMTAANRAQRQVRNKLNQEIIALLTPEQREKATLSTRQRNRGQNRNRDGNGDGDGAGQQGGGDGGR